MGNRELILKSREISADIRELNEAIRVSVQKLGESMLSLKEPRLMSPRRIEWKLLRSRGSGFEKLTGPSAHPRRNENQLEGLRHLVVSQSTHYHQHFQDS